MYVCNAAAEWIMRLALLTGLARTVNTVTIELDIRSFTVCHFHWNYVRK
ncbi:hypothetical protein CLOSTHATH_03784 [Hungatella hathewayi DSM 13479]|uniref:Uncharacterized protein n=1 Tax=Hungatella hathewayi DSM 13479 TaxID=566550 RepID=D3AJJ3_9FIRM|nr:hypothetical protein CLOSTHATH_03784 [Hungatella hathewayi DSM 13479]